MVGCRSCGESSPERARFCVACGSPVGGTAARAETRKLVTVLFTDISGSTALAARLEPESLRRVVSAYFEVVRATIGRHGGLVEKFVGDAVMAVFGIPRAREDEALRAVRAAADPRAAVGALDDELEA